MPATKNFIKAVLIAGLVAGTLDAAAASIQYMINTGKDPARVFRYVASAIFKEKASKGELYSWAAVGLFLHYLIATIWAFVFFLFFHQIRSVLKNKWVAGIVYAFFVWCIMNLLVTPLAFGVDIGDRIDKIIASPKEPLIALGILIIAIGLPISLLADRYYSKKLSS